MPPLPNMPSWRGAQLKQRDFTLPNLPLNIISVIKSRRMKWEGYVTLIGTENNAYKF
jgi:hypothetical protein